MDDAIGLQKNIINNCASLRLQGNNSNLAASLTGGATKRKRASVLSRKEEATSLEQELCTN